MAKQIGVRFRRRRRVAAAVAVLGLAFAPAAAAGSSKGSVLSTYGGSSGPLVTITQPKKTGTGLPNTGLDVAAVIAAGAGIAALGFGLRRLGRQKP